MKNNVKSKKKIEQRTNNKKGFTLVELLAVIVILAVLMITAIPAVTNSIAKSRRDTYATNAKKMIDAVRTALINGDLAVDTTVAGKQTSGGCQTPEPGAFVAVKIKDNIGQLLERGGTTSSFSKPYESGYVVVYNAGSAAGTTSGTTSDVYDKFIYYFAGVDKGKNGIDVYTSEDNLTRAVVKASDATQVADITSNSTIDLDGKTDAVLSAICKAN